MKVKDILLMAADLLGIKTDLIDYFNDEDYSMEKQAERLLTSFHLAECSLALDYVPLHREDQVYAMAGKVEYSELTASPVRILGVTDIYGEPIAYTQYSKYLTTAPGVVLVHYTYTPKMKGIDDEVDFDLLSSDSVLVYATLSEYFLGEGMTAEAAEWERKWKDLISTIYHTNKCKRLASRRWI